MNIQIASDLHLEFLQGRHPGERLIHPNPHADVLVLAGDIATSKQAARLFADWPVPVLMVAGNHEYYDRDLPDTQARLREDCQGNPVRFLENDSFTLGDVRFLGCTLWTDYRLVQGATQPQMMKEALYHLNDHALIRMERSLFSPPNALAFHEASIRWLLAELAKPWEGKTVVITHHGPHPLSVHPRYARQLLSAAYCSDLSVHTGLLDKVDLWMHGHVHDSFDYTVPGTHCRVVTNPAGYITNRSHRRPGDDWQFENPAWNPDLVLAV